MSYSTDYDLALMANAVYSDSPGNVAGWTVIPGSATREGEFFAVAFEKGDNIVIAYRGTDKFLFTDRSADLAALNLAEPWDPEFDSAIRFAEKIQFEHLGKHISVTGHSLGGSLAQVAAQMFGFDGATFDPIGAGNIVQPTNINYTNWVRELQKDHPGVAFDQGPDSVPGSVFTNYLVEHSLASGWIPDHIGATKDLDFYAYATDEELIVSTTTVVGHFALNQFNVGFLAEGVAAALTTWKFHSMVGILDLMSIKASNEITSSLQAEIHQMLQQASDTGDVGFPGAASGQTAAEYRSESYYPYVFADDGDNAIYGYPGNDVIYGFGGNDTVYAGAGDDTISTAQGDDVIDAGAGNDTIYAGSGDDTINTGTGSDTIDAGSGNDSIAVLADHFSEMDAVHGGTGIDTLTVDASGFTTATGIFWGRKDAGGGVFVGVDSTSSLQAVKTYLLGAATGQLMLNVGTTSTGVTFDGIENLSITAPTTESNTDLLIALGTGGSYDGKGGTDTFYADWSAATAGITWINDPAKTARVNGVTITGVERLLLQTGSGNDVISNTHTSTNDEIHLGAGNDTIDGGGGSDSLDGGDGIDTAVFSAARSNYTLSRTTTGFTVKSQTGDLDSLVGVERLAFSDRHIALDLQGNAGSTAKIIGAIFGKQYLQNQEFVGIGLILLDGGMTYPDLAALAVRTDLFAQLAGSRSDTAFVNLVYKNVVGIQPGQGDLDYFVGLLDTGTFSQASLALLACETDLNKVNVDLVGLANTGIEYLPMG